MNEYTLPIKSISVVVVYPMAANLSPQGSSIVKSLLRFHNGMAIQDQQAENYLMLQGANTYGEDKLRMDQKRQWVLANEREIIACANSPITTDFWKQADSPWEVPTRSALSGETIALTLMAFSVACLSLLMVAAMVYNIYQR